MKRLLIIITLMSVLNSCGQDNFTSKLKLVLASLKYSDFKVDFDKISRGKYPDIFRKQEFTRDLTEDFRESQLSAEFITDDSKSYENSTMIDLKINLIIHGNQIIFYNYEEIHSRLDTSINEWKTISSIKDSLYDKSSMSLLNKAYERNFNAPINEKEIFNSVVYGKACGYSGAPPENGKLMEEFIMKKDKESLLNWLKSTITEKQIYAVEGLYRLKKDSLKLTSDEIRIIKNVIIKKGKISTCDGCDVENSEISDIVKDWKF